MTTDALPLLYRCHHPLVRDLAWLLLVPDLIRMPWPGRPSRETLGLEDDERTTRWLDTLEAWPQPLERCIGNTLNGRMGLYHERLWQFLLAWAPGTELLAHNLRVMSGKLTLGELDLLYRRHGEASITHLEVAIKFYLGLFEGPGEPQSQARWIGPGGADSLAGKREHLHRHQLRLTDLPETRDAIRATMGSHRHGGDGLASLQRQVAMPGVLFVPWQRPLPPPREAQLSEHFQIPAAPLQIALWHPDAGWHRVFLVADDWPRQIPLPPR